MATSGRPVDDWTRREALRLRGIGKSISGIANHLDLSRPTVRKILSEDVLTSFHETRESLINNST